MKPRGLRLLILHVAQRCDQACQHCSVWKGGHRGGELKTSDRVSLIHEAASLGAGSVLFTGGEPFLCADLEILARTARQAGLTVQIATNGLGLSRSAAWVSTLVDELYVSVEGPAPIHDRVRGPGMFSRLRASLARLQSLPKRPRLVGRCVVSARNVASVSDTVTAARDLGLDALSFLPIDTRTDSFGGEPAARRFLRPGPEEVAALRASIRWLESAGLTGRFVIEDAPSLRRMADDFEREGEDRRVPACNAPEWSSVVEADGAIRPCFFQPTITGGGQASLQSARGSREFEAALERLGDGNDICAGCVCPKYAATGFKDLPRRIGRLLGRVGAAGRRERGVPA